MDSRRCLIIFSMTREHLGVIELDALVDFALLDGRERQPHAVPSRSLSPARMAFFMSSVMSVLERHGAFGCRRSL